MPALSGEPIYQLQWSVSLTQRYRQLPGILVVDGVERHLRLWPQILDLRKCAVSLALSVRCWPLRIEGVSDIVGTTRDS
jgi:hypothetical protein